ncbi:Rpn family recombination-promoting nuclease/putative transposase, partial [Treponema sp. R80B11-R83G3]
ITDFILFSEKEEFLNNFKFINPKNGLCFKEIPEEIFTLELPKVPLENDGTAVWEWMQFLRAKRKEEFEMVAVQNPEIRKAVDTLYKLSADEKVRAEYEMRQKARRDHQWLIDNARDEGMEKGIVETARKALAEGLPTDIIGKITGLS